MSKKIKKAVTHLEFLYNDLGDDVDRRNYKGPEDEMLKFEVSKGAGSVSVDLMVEYGKEGRDYDADYFVGMFNGVTSDLEKTYYKVDFSFIKFTCTDGSSFIYSPKRGLD